MLPKKILIVGIHETKKVDKVIKKLELEAVSKAKFQTFFSKSVECYLNSSSYFVLVVDHPGYLDLADDIVSDTDALVFIVEDVKQVDKNQLLREGFIDKLRVFIDFQKESSKMFEEKVFLYKKLRALDFYEYITKSLFKKKSAYGSSFLKLFESSNNFYPDETLDCIKSWIVSCKESLKKEKKDILSNVQQLIKTLDIITFNALEEIHNKLEELSIIKKEITNRRFSVFHHFYRKFTENLIFGSELVTKLKEINLKLVKIMDDPYIILCKNLSLPCISLNNLSIEEFFPATSEQKSINLKNSLLFEYPDVLTARMNGSYLLFQETVKKNDHFFYLSFNLQEQTIHKQVISFKHSAVSSVRFINPYFFIISEVISNNEKLGILQVLQIEQEKFPIIEENFINFELLKSFKYFKHFFVVEYGSNFLVSGSSSKNSAFNIFLCDLKQKRMTSHITISQNSNISGKIKFISAPGENFTLIFFKSVFIQAHKNERKLMKLNLEICGKVKTQPVTKGYLIYFLSTSSLKHIIYRFSLISKNLEIIKTFDL